MPAGLSLLLLSIPYGMTTNYVAMYARQIEYPYTNGFFFTLWRSAWPFPGYSPAVGGSGENNAGNFRRTVSWSFSVFFLLASCVYHHSMEQHGMQQLFFGIAPCLASGSGPIDKFNFAGKKAIVRVDFNVPLDENGKITDDTRIRGALPTLKKVLADGGSLIIMSHMGKPKGKVNAKYSLSQIVDAVSEKLGVPVQFAPDCAKAGDAAAALKPGEVLLLENLRFYPEEEGKPVGIDKEDPAYEDAKKAMKASQKEFAKTLASYADCYINDAFGTAHRKHASTAVIADYFDADNKMLGYLMEKEVQAVDNILKDIKRPFTAIMGGSKVSTKIGIIENLMDKVDNLILCGGMTYTFAKAQGGKIGNSIVEDDKLELALDIIAKAKAKGVNLVLGSDCVAADAFSNDAHTQVVPANNIPDGWEGLDAGPETQKAFAAAIEDAKTILWNGPAGVFEFDNFTDRWWCGT